jgi:hypothetical protein
MSLYSTDTKLRAETPWDITAPLCTQDESCSSAWVLDIPWTLSHVTILPTKTAFSKTFVKSYLLLCLFVFFFFSECLGFCQIPVSVESCQHFSRPHSLVLSTRIKCSLFFFLSLFGFMRCFLVMSDFKGSLPVVKTQSRLTLAILSHSCVQRTVDATRVSSALDIGPLLSDSTKPLTFSFSPKWICQESAAAWAQQLNSSDCIVTTIPPP